jgi:hypothetical protein
MTTELEKQFFEVFEIPKIFKTNINTGDLDLNYVEIQAPTLKELYEEAQYDLDTPIYFSWFKRSKRWSEEYPQITDKQYLELILVYSEIRNLPICYSTVEGFKEAILECFIEDSEDYSKHQVQAIFKGERW